MPAGRKSRRQGRPSSCGPHEYKDFEMLEHPHQIPVKAPVKAP
jgi:hypothetical protein